MIKFHVPGPPQSKLRHRTVVSGGVVRAYTPAKTRKNEDAGKYIAKIAMGDTPLIYGAVHVEIHAVFSRPKHDPKRPCHIVKPDLDNIIKQIADIMNGIVLHDDKQITSVIASKSYGDAEGVTVTIAATPDLCYNQGSTASG